ncbi:MAG: hypothetical protein JXR86_14425 [Spirochaetales bacterium]|nr:hypothetical protein [Spirochaetales bacterium]
MKRLFPFLIISLSWVLSAQSGEISIGRIDIEFIGKVRTNEPALRKYMDLKEGDIFPSPEILNEALNEQIRILKNTRYFNSVEMTAQEGEGESVYDILLTLEDGWTFVPIPYPLPDSSVGLNGWSFGMEVNYDNFFGSMADFYFDGYANIAFGEETRLKAWKLTPQIKNIKIGDLKLNGEYTQEYKTTEVTDPSEPEGQQVRQHYTNHASVLGVSTNFRLGGNWSYAVSPKFGFKYGYDYHDDFEGDTVQDNISVIEDPFYFSFEHNLTVGQVDWVGPLRKGYSAGLSNTLSLMKSYYRDSDEESFRFVPELNLSGRFYIPFLKRLNYYTRAEVLWSINNQKYGLGSKLRGVQNSSMYGDLGFFWLNTLGIEIWGNDTIHIQLHPFADMGIAISTEESNSFIDKFRIGFGTELIVMIGSVDLKGKYGYDPVSRYHDFSFVTGFSY